VAVSTNSAMAGSNAAVVVRRSPARRVRRDLRPVAVAGMGAGIATGSPELQEALERLAPTADPRGLDPSAQMVILAAALALRDGGLRISTELRDRAGLVLGNGRLSPATIRAFRASIAGRGLWRLSTSAFARRMPSAPAGACAAALELRGPASTIATGEGEGLCAVAYAAQLLAGREDAEVILAGGVREEVDGTGAAAVLALRAGRGAVELAGWGMAGAGLEGAALEQALARAGVRPSEVSVRFDGAFAPAVEAVRSGAAGVAAAVTPGGCASCALVFRRGDQGR
jgi:hypothetical protein